MLLAVICRMVPTGVIRRIALDLGAGCLFLLFSCKLTSKTEDFRGIEEKNRIVVVGTPLYLDILKAYDELSSVVAVVDSPDNPVEVASLPRVGTSFFPHIEAVLAEHPDIILGVVEPLKSKLPPYVRFLSGEKMIRRVSELRSLIQELGSFLHKPQKQIDTILQQFDTQISEQSEKAKFYPKTKIIFLFPTPVGDLYTSGQETIEDELMTMAGGENLLSKTAVGRPVSIETILEKDPEMIFTDPVMVRNIERDPRLAHLKAVRNKKVVGVRMADFVSIRAPFLLAFLVKTLHE